MASASLIKIFQPEERLPLQEIQRQHQLFAGNGIPRMVFDAVPTAFCVLNMKRQIVLGNRALVQLTGAASEEALLGRRPGEALNCIHAENASAGCGSTEFCSTCGTAQALSAGEAGQASSKECRLTRIGAGGQKESVELMVAVEPITVSGESFLSCSMLDVSHERRRRALERVFFHDLMNSAAGLILAADSIRPSSTPEEVAQSANLIRDTSLQLVSEIRCHESLLSAENGELKVQPSRFNTLDMLTLFFEQYQQQFLHRECTLSVAADADDIKICSDQALLGRVLGNMLKNALEASTAGSGATLGSRRLGDRFEIWVHNPQYMPQHVQRQVFQRSFSTKDTDRGLGTYSMRLLSERYLRGSVEFSSDKKTGTTFYARYPIELIDVPTENTAK